LAVGVAGGDATFTKFGQHGRVVNAQVCADTRQRPVEVVEVDGVVDLLRQQSAPPHRDLVSVEDVADRPPFDAEPIAQLIDRRPGLVPGDEFLDLVGVELACPSWFGSVDRPWSRCSGVGQLPEQCLQGFYMGFVL
jgi:hypothetical protein